MGKDTAENQEGSSKRSERKESVLAIGRVTEAHAAEVWG